MAPNSIPQLVDKAYQAAGAPPQAWEDFLQGVMRQFDALNGTLWHRSQGEFLSNATISPNVPDPRTHAEMISCDPYIARQGTAPLARGVLGQQLVSLRELRRTRYYADFGRHLGGVHLLGAILLRDRSSVGVIALFRADRSKPFDDHDRERLDALAPHLRQATRLAQRLRSVQERLDGSAAALYDLDQAVLLLDERGRVVLASARAEKLLGLADPLCVHAGRLRLRYGDEQPLRIALSRAAGANQAGTRGEILCLPRRTDPMGLLVTIAPLGPEHPVVTTVSGLPRVIVKLTAQFQGAGPSADRLRRRFDLTAAQAELAEALCAGERLADYAADHGVSINTVRTHLRGLLRRTGTRRQAELIFRLMG